MGILLAKWVWVLLAPANTDMPATVAWKKSDDAERLFGTTNASTVPAAALLGNVRLVGVFAHPTKGFAMFQIDNKQLGVVLGGQVVPGVKLLETHANHVILERGASRLRLALQSGELASDLTSVADPVKAPSTSAREPATGYTPAAEFTPAAKAALQQLNPQQSRELLSKIPPAQREAYKHLMNGSTH